MESFGKSCDKESQLESSYNDWDCDTFVVSTKEDSRSLSSSSWDLDPNEFVIPSAILCEGMSLNAGVEGPSENIQMKEDYLDLEKQNQYGNYDELLKKFIQNEEELRISNSKLEYYEENILKLNIQAMEFDGQLNDMQKELKQKEDDLEYEKGRVLEMQKQKAELIDCCDKITKFEEMLEMVANEQLKLSSNEIARLTKELESKLFENHELQGQLKVAEKCVAKLECEFDSGRKQNQDLEERITWYKAYETKFELELQKLKAEMVDVQKKFSSEKDKLHFDILSLSKINKDLTSRNNEYEKNLRQCAIANLKQEELHAAQQKTLKAEMNSLMVEIEQRKQEFDVVVTEREEASTKIDVLEATIISREDQVHRLKSYTSKCLHRFKESLLRVEKLAREVTRQNGVISNLEVENEEANEEVENYKSKYQQLLQESSNEDSRCLFFW